jgi:hypothetical protein
MRCSVCANPQVSEVDLLLSTGTSVRQVARLTGIPRTTLGRHAVHIAPTSRKLGLIPGQAGPDGPADPLAEALLLAEKARTPRERLRALEQVRAATRLRLRQVDDPDEEDRSLLDSNIRAAEAAFRDAPDFESAARGLSGWREAIAQRLDAVRQPGSVEVSYGFVMPGREPLPSEKPRTSKNPLSVYFQDVPRRFRDVDRFQVNRTIHLTWPGTDPLPHEIRVVEKATGATVWASGV